MGSDRSDRPPRLEVTRREFCAAAAAARGASLAWGCFDGRPSAVAWRERRDLFPEGVASGDPQADSVLLWTRYPRDDGATEARLTLEVSEDAAFQRLVASAPALVSAASDWTCRVLAGG